MIGTELLHCEGLPVTVISPDEHRLTPHSTFYHLPDHTLISQGIHPTSELVTSRLVSVEFAKPQEASAAYTQAHDRFKTGRALSLECTVFVADDQERGQHPVRVELPMGGMRLADETHLEVLVYVHPESILNHHNNPAAAG